MLKCCADISTFQKKMWVSHLFLKIPGEIPTDSVYEA